MHNNTTRSSFRRFITVDRSGRHLTRIMVLEVLLLGLSLYPVQVHAQVDTPIESTADGAEDEMGQQLQEAQISMPAESATGGEPTPPDAGTAYTDEGPDTSMDENSGVLKAIEDTDGNALVELNEKGLTFHGIVNDALQRSVTMKVAEGAIHDVHIVVNDLVHQSEDVPILSNKITVNPAQVDSITDVQRFDVTVNGAGVQAGIYDGAITFWYSALTSSIPISLPMTVTFESAPNVTADPNSQNQILSTWTWFWPPPYIGRAWAKGPNGVPLGNISYFLLEDGLDVAQVEGVQVLSMVGSDGASLPGDAVYISSTVPFSLPGQSAKPMDIVLTGSGLPAGEFTGNMMVTVRNQAPALQVPIKVRLKHHYGWALIVLLSSITIAFGVSWYNKRGLTGLGTVRKLERAEKRWEKNTELLQDVERSNVRRKLDRAWDALQADDSASAVTKILAEIESVYQNQQTAVQQLLAQCSQLEAELIDPAYGQKAATGLQARLEMIRTDIKGGQFRSLAAAQDAFDGVKGDKALLDSMQVALKDQPEEVKQAVAEVDDVTEIGELLKQAFAKQVDAVIETTGSIEVGTNAKRRIDAELNTVKASILATTDFSQMPALEDRLTALANEANQIVSLQPQLQLYDDVTKNDFNMAKSLPEIFDVIKEEMIEQIDAALDAAKPISIGTLLQTKLIKQLTRIKGRLDTVVTIAELQNIDGIIVDIKQDIEQLAAIQSDLATLGTDLKDKINRAGSLKEIQDLRKSVQPPPVKEENTPIDGVLDPGEAAAALEGAGLHGAYGLPDSSVVDSLLAGWQGKPPADESIPVPWDRFNRRKTAETVVGARRWMTVRLRVGSMMVQFAALLFALVVGWATLYWTNPTFGAKPADYVTLFLWGAAVNIFGGNAIDLKNLTKTVEVTEGAEVGSDAGNG